MFTFLLVLHAIVASSLVAVILMQRSEGGGLGMGGSPSGLMSARGAADFLTRATTILATIFVVMSIGLAAYAGVQRAQRPIDTSLARPAGGVGGAAPAGGGLGDGAGGVPGAGPGGGVPLADPLSGAAAGMGAASQPLIPQTAPPSGSAPRAEAAPPPAKRRVAEQAPASPSAERRPAAATTLPASAPAASPTPTPKADSTPVTLTPPAPAGNSAVPIAQ